MASETSAVAEPLMGLALLSTRGEGGPMAPAPPLMAFASMSLREDREPIVTAKTDPVAGRGMLGVYGRHAASPAVGPAPAAPAVLVVEDVEMACPAALVAEDIEMTPPPAAVEADVEMTPPPTLVVGDVEMAGMGGEKPREGRGEEKGDHPTVKRSNVIIPVGMMTPSAKPSTTRPKTDPPAVTTRHTTVDQATPALVSAPRESVQTQMPVPISQLEGGPGILQPPLQPVGAIGTGAPIALDLLLERSGNLEALVDSWWSLLSGPGASEALVEAFARVTGLLFQEVSPVEVLGPAHMAMGIVPDYRRDDLVAAGTFTGAQWTVFGAGDDLAWMLPHFVQNGRVLQALIQRWASSCGMVAGCPASRAHLPSSGFAATLRRAGWQLEDEWVGSACYQTVAALKRMPPGAARAKLWEQAKEESPRVFAASSSSDRQDPSPKRKRDEGTEALVHHSEAGAAQKRQHRRQDPSVLHRRFLFGMQIRCVPDDELAIGPDGKKLPFAIVTKDDRRKHVEETGPFGKSRRGRTRSKTPAMTKKDDPSLAAFDEAFRYDLSKQEAEKQRLLQPHAHDPHSGSLSSPSSLTTAPTATSLTVVDSLAISSLPASVTTRPQEPTEVLLRGFRPGQQYAAIDLYERIGQGQICEDYSRDPPTEQRRFGSSRTYPPRPLTAAEKGKVNAYAGGDSWIKVTFESAEAADRAVYASPQDIHGAMVYAELYRGPPETAPSLPHTSSSFSTALAPSTLSSSRRPGLDHAVASGIAPQLPAEGYCTKVPTARKAVLLPAEQALLPQQSFSQRYILPYVGNWGQIIGDETPRLDDGTFDYYGANLWWKTWYWMDIIFRLHLIDD
ncbi:MAG: hypothetical protein M1838_005026 [Thelocarpon superellum]|nr:MAG: hypothetical protein M1838_005026 [Thelocarpon superellum]